MECCRTAEYMPTGMAKVHVTRMVNPVRATVSQSRSSTTCLTGFWAISPELGEPNERPRSPLSSPPSQRK